MFLQGVVGVDAGREGLPGDGAHHDDAEEHGSRRDPEELVAKCGAAEEGGERAAAAQRHRGLEITRSHESQIACDSGNHRLGIEFGEAGEVMVIWFVHA